MVHLEASSGLGALIALGALLMIFVQPKRAGLWGGISASGVCFFLASLWMSTGPLSWTGGQVHSLGMSLRLEWDALAAALGVFVSAIAALVLVFSRAYLPHHLQGSSNANRAQRRFCLLILLFMSAMLALFVAQDLLLMFAALELTSLTSFLLIEFDENDEARSSARTALLVTGGSSLLFFMGAIVLGSRVGTTDLAVLASSIERGEETVALVLLTLGVLAKSAQWPLHFWLPRAMVAPTPVSAYLHSAALVAAGVFVLLRLQPLIAEVFAIKVVLLAVGAGSIIVGGFRALLGDHIKEILAYSTIAQYGYAMVMLASGGEKGVLGAVVFLVAHGVCKCALFLMAGALVPLGGIEHLSQAGGLRRKLPVLATASGIAAAGLAGLPLTIGFFKDELLFKSVEEESSLVVGLSVFAVAISFGYSGRLWWRIFAGSETSSIAPFEKRVSESLYLVGPVVALSLLSFVGGVFAPLLDETLLPAARASLSSVGWTGSESIHYPDHVTSGVVMTILAWLLGGAFLTVGYKMESDLRRLFDGLSRHVGPRTLVLALSRAAGSVSDGLWRRERFGRSENVVKVVFLVSTIVAVSMAALVGQIKGGGIRFEDSATLGALAFAAVAAVTTLWKRDGLSLVLLASFSGMGLVVSFCLMGAPDVALVILLVETLMTLVLLGLLAFLPASAKEPKARRDWGGAAGVFGGCCVAGLTLVSLSYRAPPLMAQAYLELSEQAHAKDAVTAILADFRGLDTAVEVTVFAVAILGAAAHMVNSRRKET